MCGDTTLVRPIPFLAITHRVVWSFVLGLLTAGQEPELRMLKGTSERGWRERAGVHNGWDTAWFRAETGANYSQAPSFWFHFRVRSTRSVCANSIKNCIVESKIGILCVQNVKTDAHVSLNGSESPCYLLSRSPFEGSPSEL